MAQQGPQQLFKWWSPGIWIWAGEVGEEGPDQPAAPGDQRVAGLRRPGTPRLARERSRSCPSPNKCPGVSRLKDRLELENQESWAPSLTLQVLQTGLDPWRPEHTAGAPHRPGLGCCTRAWGCWVLSWGGVTSATRPLPPQVRDTGQGGAQLCGAWGGGEGEG